LKIVKRFSEMSVYNKPAQRNIPEDGILHSHRRESLKSYNSVFVATGYELDLRGSISDRIVSGETAPSIHCYIVLVAFVDPEPVRTLQSR
jgi:hypothetical protein